MTNPSYLSGSARQVGEKLQEQSERWMYSTRKWAEVLTFDPDPQTGMTPKEIVWRKNKAKLYRYLPSHGLKHRTPILMLYALINEAYILDLAPGMSLVEHLVQQGYDVYLLEWGDFQWEDRHLTLTDLVFNYIATAVQKVCQYSRTDELSLLGYCMGGTMASMYASLFDMPRIRNLIFLAVPFDFAEAGVAGQWINNEHYDVNKIVDTLELIPSSFIDNGVKMLNPVANFWGTYTRLWKLLDDDAPIQSWKVLNKWVNDNKNFPGGAFRQWAGDLYQANQLIQGKMMLRGRRVDLCRIEAAVLVMTGAKDHLVLPRQSIAGLEQMASGDKTYREYPIGHGGLVFGNIAKQQVYPFIDAWLAKRS